jgi:polyphosphate kinase
MAGMAGLDVSVEDSGAPGVGAALDPPTQLQPESRYLNRELSALDYFARVLAIAADRSVPVLERVKFLAIVSQNVDEFFQVRVSGLREQFDAGIRATSADGLEPGEQLRAIRTRVEPLMERQAAIFTHEIAPALDDAGAGIYDWETLSDADRKHLQGVFDERVFPVLTPLAVEAPPPLPYI